MRKASTPPTPSPPPPSSAPRRRRTGTSPRDPLADLSARFARFRQEHLRGARVPRDLRAAVLAALRDGVSAGELYRACGITWGQVAAWKVASAAPPRQAAEPEGPAARVFEVIDEPRHEVTSAGYDLEVRVGPWSLKVRLADDGVVGG